MGTRLSLRLEVTSTCRKCRGAREAYYGRMIVAGARVMFFQTRTPHSCGGYVVAVRPRFSAV